MKLPEGEFTWHSVKVQNGTITVEALVRTSDSCVVAIWRTDGRFGNRADEFIPEAQFEINRSLNALNLST